MRKKDTCKKKFFMFSLFLNLCIVTFIIFIGCSPEKVLDETHSQKQLDSVHTTNANETDNQKHDNSPKTEDEEIPDEVFVSLAANPISYFDKTLTDDIIWSDLYDDGYSYFLVDHSQPIISNQLKNLLNNSSEDEYAAVYVEYSNLILVPKCTIDIASFPEDMRENTEIMNLYNNTKTSYNTFACELNVLLYKGETLYKAIYQVADLHSKAWNDYNEYYNYVSDYASQKMYDYLREKNELTLEYGEKHFKENGTYPSQEHLKDLDWYQNAEKDLELYTNVYNSILKEHYLSCMESRDLYFSSRGLIPYYSIEEIADYYNDYYVTGINREFSHIYVAKVKDLFKLEEESGNNSKSVRIFCATKEMLID